MVNKNIPTGYANSKGRVIFTSTGGKPYVRTAEGKKSYAPKAAFAINNGSARKLTKATANKVPISIRPKRVVKRSTPKKNVFASVKKAASPNKTVSKTAKRMNTRHYLINRGFTKAAAARVAPLVNAGKPSYRYSKVTGMRRKQGGRSAKKPAAKNTLVKRTGNMVRRTATKSVSNSLKMGQQFSKMMNKMVSRKPNKARANKGKARALVASPGGRLYKGRAAMARRKVANDIRKNATIIANTIKKFIKMNARKK